MALLTKYDLDGDGVMSTKEMEIIDQKSRGQRRMAWVAIWTTTIITVLLVSPIVPETRVAVLSDLIGLFYIGQASVVGAYMGFTSWMQRK